ADDLMLAGAAGGVDDDAGVSSPTDHPERDHVRDAGRSPNFVIVGTPPPEIPSPLTTFRTVPNRMRMSSQSDQLSAYQTSSSNFCSHGSSLRPLICASPVMPGVTSCRRICSGV